MAFEKIITYENHYPDRLKALVRAGCHHRTIVLWVSSASSVALVAGDGVVFAAGTLSFTRPSPSLPIFPRSRAGPFSSSSSRLSFPLSKRLYFECYSFVYILKCSFFERGLRRNPILRQTWRSSFGSVEPSN